MSPDSRRAFEQYRAQQLGAEQAASSGPSIIEQLLLSPFKAASFREPANGLVYMRDRWYDPSTGTFPAPDPEGYGDSSNLYIFGKGDPVNNSDPTGRYIDESDILASPLAQRYIEWRDQYLRSPLGRQVWNQLHAIPASVFALEVADMAPDAQGAYASGAETSNFYDMTGVQDRARIEFSTRFGDDPGSDPLTSSYYRYGVDVYNQDRGGFLQYAFGHEIGHVLGGWDSTMSARTRLFSNVGAQINATTPTFSTLLSIPPASRTPAQQQQYQQLALLRSALLTQQVALKPALENYGDDIGFQIYRSFRQANRRLFGLAPVGGRNFTPPPQLPTSATANIPQATP
jgi:RHS repeat-associated protein